MGLDESQTMNTKGKKKLGVRYQKRNQMVSLSVFSPKKTSNNNNKNNNKLVNGQYQVFNLDVKLSTNTDSDKVIHSNGLIQSSLCFLPFYFEL